MSEPSSTNQGNGHDKDGKFAVGNKLGKGNPFASQVNKLRSAMLNAVTAEDMTALTARLLAQSLKGNVAASRVLLDRLLGPSVACDILERLERLEATIEQENLRHGRF